MKIYFSGSIRGGRDDVPLYLQIVQHLKNFGEVLTEHIADAHITSYGEAANTDQELYTRDVAMIDQCDVLVAEVTTVSLGVGYELGYAEGKGKKVMCLYRPQEGKRLSVMIAGNPSFPVKEYSSVEEAYKIIDTYFNSLD